MTHHSSLIHPELDGRPIVLEGGRQGALLLHGLTATPVEVRALAEHLHQQGWSVRGPLLPGHGTTPADLNRTTRRDWQQAVQREYDALRAQCDHVILIGESAGGLLSLDLATRHPEIRAVVVLAPALRLARPWWEQGLMFAAAPFVESVPKQASSKEESGWQGYAVNPLRAGCELVRLQGEVWGNLPRLQQPLLVFQGGQDTTVAPAFAAKLLQRVSSGMKQIRWFPEAGHVLLLESVADVVLHEIDAFLASLDGT